MNVVVIGTGYVGLVTGTCLADSGNDVTCVDIDAGKVERLKNGEIPIYEPGLEDMVRRNSAAGRLSFTTQPSACVPGAECVFIAVGTPQDEDGSADLKYVMGAAEAVAPYLRKNAIVIIKSTVPVGTNRLVKRRLDELTGRDVHIASNPEFLKEGCAIDDFMRPDRVVVGSIDPDVAETVHELYKPFLRTEKPFLKMGLESAEMTKYVANCMLATKISFINEMANLCELVGADINDVRRGIGHDQRIGFAFLFPGVGYGGSCFPKDVRALRATGKELGFETSVLHAVDDVNTRQKLVLFNKLARHFKNDLAGKKIAVWGLSFKPKTDDIRDAPSLELLRKLIAAGANVHVHDPVAVPNVQRVIGDAVTYHSHQYDTLEQAEALAIVTEWNEYRNPDFDYILHKMKSPVIFDGRNLYDLNRMTKLGFTYSGIGVTR
ncbi:UDP-glucose dehydrogenase family protein [Planctomicrobium piriforme]|uniref:UDP-glucose 6-dehydrogenase n=1 Tax=Planctomicrobium piriforme TaxID=1576369 RepID=A0A1I3DDD7_9PLAN|nr:UDP-glucose/GDP-mannose dehydrogenase family protein [Planctomicrobium piriforme]SFH84744.1 UDPglucose 6-dehydrogenase [Planctomicrobium piriforme]